MAQIGHVWTQVEPNGPDWGPSWRQVGPNGDTTWEHCFKRSKKTCENTSENRHSEDFGFGRLCPQLRPKLLPNGSMLGPSWSQVVGAKWVQVVPKLTPSRANVAAMSDRNGAFGRCWPDLQNVQITKVPCTFWRPAWGEHAQLNSSRPTTKRHLRCVRIFYNLELHCSSEPDPLARNFTGWLWILICRNLRTLLFPTNFLDGTSSKTPPLLGHQLFQEASNLFDVFGRQLEGIGKMLMCLDKMKEGNYTTRIWCIFEARICVVIRKTSQRRFCGFTWYRCGTCFGLKPSNFKKALDMILAYAHVTLGFCDGATLPYCPHENAVMMAPGNRCSPCFLINRLLFPLQLQLLRDFLPPHSDIFFGLHVEWYTPVI